MEYHEIYGWLPKSAIDCIPEHERRKAFVAWVTQNPNPAGRYIVNVVVKSLGDDFLNYILDGLISCAIVEEEDLTADLLKNELTNLLDSWATDANLLMMAMEHYREDVLHLDEIPFNEEEKPKSLPKRDSKGRFIKNQ